MTAAFSIINGDFVTNENAGIHISDLALQRGYGVFDFFTAINGKLVFLEDHLARLFYSADKMHLQIWLSRKKLTELIYALIEKNKIPNAGIRITVTGGDSPDGYSIGKANIIIQEKEFAFDKELFGRGLALMSFQYPRQFPDVKTIDYSQAIYLSPLMLRKGADDILYHENGIVTECPRSNFFIVTRENEIITPEKNILHGVTRKKILSLKGYRFVEGQVDLEFLFNVKEAFISSTTKAVVPVLRVDNIKIGDGKPGQTTRQIFNELSKMKGVL